MFTPTFTEVKKFIEKSETNDKLSKVMVHVGINDLDKGDSQSLSDIEVSVHSIHSKFPSATIFISSLIQRKDNKCETEINKTNLFISSLTTKNSYVKIMDNSKILPHMLYDEKHLNRNGFKIFLGNIRFVLFNMIPHVYIMKNYNGYNQRSQRVSRYNMHNYEKGNQ